MSITRETPPAQAGRLLAGHSRSGEWDGIPRPQKARPLLPTARIRRGVGWLVVILLAGWLQSSRAEPGNLLGWTSNALNELTFTCQFAVVKLELLDTNVARVRVSTNGVPFSTNASFTVVRAWPRPPFSIEDGSTLVVSNAGLQVQVSRTPFRLTFCSPDGTSLLTDTNTSGLAYQTNASSARFLMPAEEQYYGLGLVLGKPLSYRGQTRVLYNARTGFSGGAMTDMAVPLVVSSRGYGVFVDNTYRQSWTFTNANLWTVQTLGGELNYYFIGGGTPAGVLDSYTQMTGRAPLPPRWALGYAQSKYGYQNWGEVMAARDGFRTNDLPCDGLVLDLYWFGQPSQMGALAWNSGSFPNAASNLAALAGTGIKVMNIHEEYINRDNAPASANFAQAAAAHYLLATDAAMTSPRIVQGFFGSAGYVDFLNPAARNWWFGKLQPIINDGVAAHWTDLREPAPDNASAALLGGRRQSEIHNVYNLLWHQGLAEGYAASYPTQRLYLLSRSGFAGDQRFGAAHWSNDTAANWPTLEAHPNALCNYGMSGLSYLGSDIGGFSGLPSDELYVRWFQFGAFCPAFRAHGDHKAVAPYEFSQLVEDHCRTMLKLRYRLLPYIYTVARETFDTGLPMCRPLPLAFPADANGRTNGTEFMFGPNLLVAPVTTQGATSRNLYLPAGNWIDHWTGQMLSGPQTIPNSPAPLARIPLFYRSDSITPLGPYVASSQFDDGTQRSLRIYCESAASGTIYDDDTSSTAYLNGQCSSTTISAMVSSNVVTISVGGAGGTYPSQPPQRAWGIELYCTNAVSAVVADGVPLVNVTGTAVLAATNAGYFLDGAEHLLRIKLPAAAITQPHRVSASLNPAAPPPWGARINAGGRLHLDQSGGLWAEDQPYVAGSYGYLGGTTFDSANPITNTPDPRLYQTERYGTSFSYEFDVPNGQYEIKLLDADTYNSAPGVRLFNVYIGGQWALTNFDIVSAAGGKNMATTVTLTNTVSSGHLTIQFVGAPGSIDPNARISGIEVRKIADPDSDGDSIPDWWTQLYFGHPTGQADDNSRAQDSAAGDGISNLQKYLSGKNPLIWDNLHFISCQYLGEGSCSLRIFGQVGRNYVLQASTNLLDWVSVMTFACTNGTMNVLDQTAANSDNRFYRLATLESAPGLRLGIASPDPQGPDGFNLVLLSASGLFCRIDTSSDLVTWDTLTNLLSTNAVTGFQDTAATNFAKRFYRAVLP